MNFDVSYPDCGIEITLDNYDVLLFNLFRSNKYGICLRVETMLNDDDINPDDILSNISEEGMLKKIAIFEDGICTLDVKGQRKYISSEIKEVVVFNDDDDTILDNFVRYNKKTAEKYGLNVSYAYDYFDSVKKKILK